MTETDNPVLQFLHLSDIHCTDRNGIGVFDLDSDLRRAINMDASTLREQLGDFTGILITGDIAFAASDDEYEKASAWLDELQSIVGSSADHTYTVPGNHDIIRKAAEAPAVSAFHNELRSCELNDIDSRLNRWLSDANPDNELPYRPLSSYNTFAERYGCALQPGNLCWDVTIPLGHGFTLGIRGFTSVFCSNCHDDTGKNKLVVGLAQATMPIERGRANLSLCHHPPDWLRDADTTQEAMLAGTHIQLYGHKHIHWLHQIDESVVVSAGATHPERGDTWEPRYNAIQLSVDHADDVFLLAATVYPRVFKTATRRFQPDYQQGGSEFREFRIQLPAPNLTAGPRDEIAQAPSPAVTSESAAPETGVLSRPDEGVVMHPLRRLGYILAELPDHRRLQMARDLHLLEDSESDANAALLIQRARERDQLKSLWEAAAEFTKDSSPNPFERNEQK